VGDSYLSGRPRTIFHSRLSCRHVGLWTSQPASTRLSVKFKIISLSRMARGPDRWMSRSVMLGFGQRFTSHSRSVTAGSWITASVGVGVGRPRSSLSKRLLIGQLFRFVLRSWWPSGSASGWGEFFLWCDVDGVWSG